MKRRPTLVPGDVCKVSKKHRNMYNRKHTYIVDYVGGDGSEGNTRVRCLFITKNKRYPVGKVVVRRADLWFTGYNQNKPQTRGGKATRKITKFPSLVPNSTAALKTSNHPCHCPQELVFSSGCKCGGF